MLIKEALETARDYFLHTTDKETQYTVMKHFAKEVAVASDQALTSWVVLFHNGFVRDTAREDFQTFLMWYYVNYFLPPHAMAYDATCHELPRDSFVSTEIAPMKGASEGKGKLAVRCQPEEANYWTVFMKTGEGAVYPAADCKDQVAAQMVQFLLHRIAPSLKLPGL